MNSQNQVYNDCPNMTSNTFKHLVNAFLIPSPCILIQDKIVMAGDIYDLLDFDNHGGILPHTIQFWNAYQTGFVFTIVVLDIKTGEILKRSHRLNDLNLQCDWVLIMHDYLNPVLTSKEQLLKDFHANN